LIQVATPDVVSRRSEKLRDKLLGTPGADDDLRRAARSDYGIEIVDVRLRRFNYPASVRPSIYDRIVSERNKKAADYLGEGLKRAEQIKAAADREVRTLLADARADEQRLKKQADADADAIRAQAFAKDRDFYVFLQKLESYQKMLAETRDVLLLSAKNELF